MNRLWIQIRQLINAPTTSIMVILTLALGVGATVAVFSVVRSVLIDALPYPDAERVVAVMEQRPDGGSNSVSGGAYKDWAHASQSFEHLAIFEATRANISGSGVPEQLPGLRVSTQFLPVLGIQPQLGRNFGDGDDQPGGNNTSALISAELWQQRFDGSPAALGQTINIDQIPHTIIGVLPPASMPERDVAFLVPTVIDGDPAAWTRSGHWRIVIGRLAPGVSSLQAQTELRAIKQRMNEEYPEFKQGWSVSLMPLREYIAGPARPTLLLLMGTVVLLLLIACANVSNLLLARGSNRTTELALRAALGARSSTIVAHVLAESTLLAIAGGTLGLVVAVFGVEILGAMIGGHLPAAVQPRADLGLFATAFALASLCGLIAGLIPALRASSMDLNVALRSGERGNVSAAKKRSQNVMVAVQFGFTMILLVGSGLFIRSFVGLLQVDPGFEKAQTIAFDLNLAETRYADDQQRLAAMSDLREQLQALPGVESVSHSSTLPLSGRDRTEFVSRADRVASFDYTTGVGFVSETYFATLGMKLLRGRLLTAADYRADSRTLVVDSKLASELYVDANPVGERLRFLGEEWEIVGVTAPVQHSSLFRAPIPRVYLPQVQSLAETSFVLRSELPAESLSAAIRATVRSFDETQAVANMRTMSDAFSRSLSTERTTASLIGVFAVIAVVLACIGIYGVISQLIALRRRELSIRRALGAQRGQVLKLILRQGLGAAVVGVSIGLVSAFGLSRFLSQMLFQITPHDPWTYLGTTMALLSLAVIMIAIPAFRATRGDNIPALHSD